MLPWSGSGEDANFCPDASCLIVVGLGGIGRSICHWTADKGARDIIVMSRSAGSSKKSHEVVEEVRKLGIKLLPVSCDVSGPLALSHAVEESGKTMPPDSILEQMTLDAWLTATRPKVHGSLNLHKQFSNPEVDFFIMLSSLSGVTGFVSQSNYAAGNTLQDAMALHRVCSGLHAVSIDIGIVNSVGHLIEHKEQMERLRKQ
ncbi:hypothetical protein INS49_004814 [Diaporthe citri]|uniref:uncharacterized protein n=1 Tax=Diaporthe citri TaxID=83186 RepID=UPI001C819333|nr:uncharacterized protein INS49_004814 [Diaporthe citri]KAG6354210.1 hypothetical protein INS49_004814 [Diaporthe citri]